MKVEISNIVQPGLARGAVGQVVTVKKARRDDATGTVFSQIQTDDGRQVNVDYSSEEAIQRGMEMIVAGCLASGSMPPLVLTQNASVFRQ